MPLYFFHTIDGTRQRDVVGTDLPDHASARCHAIKFAGDVLSDEPRVIWDGRDFRVEVTDGSGQMVFTIVTLAVDAPSTSLERLVAPPPCV